MHSTLHKEHRVRQLGEIQRAFARALRDPREAPMGEDPAGRPDPRRFAVYRNNVATSLIESLAAGYPAVRRLVGDTFFRACAGRYAAQAPPRSPIMLLYGDRFADFLARFEPLAEYPYLADVARIERAWLEAYHAAEAEPLAPSALARFGAHRAGDLCFTLHPSVRIVRSTYPALTLWRVNVHENAPAPIRLDSGAEDALVARPGAEVQVRAVPPCAASFLKVLSQGGTLAEAAAAAASASAAFDLTAHIAALLKSGLITAARLRGRRSRLSERQSVCR
jgi:hypothetical protein